MIVVVFRSRLRTDVNMPEIEAAGGRMYELASAMPGFISYKDFTAADGESVSIVEFATLADSTRWRDQPEHRAVQELGKQDFFSEYRVQVCDLVRESRQP
jgi:heme-degrading monooxygenase HmoA